MKKLTSLILCCIILSLSLIGCSSTNQEPISQTGFAFDTVITIKLYDSTDTNILAECIALCEKYEHLFSATLEGSDIWNINHANGQAVTVSEDTIALLTEAISYCEMTEGILNLTLRPISALWDFSGQIAASPDTYYIPTDDELSDLMTHVDYRNVHILENNQVQIADAEAQIDLGFIAKGFIADRLKEYLLSQGVNSALIDLGGNILTVGCKPDGSGFLVGVKRPYGNDAIATKTIIDSSMVSSGCYERYFEQDGIQYHHILDSTTGYPIDNDLLGVTILSESSTMGDAYSTYCYILGLEKGMEFILSQEGVEAIFITKDYELHFSY
ncbi:MAG: FAD:protein FMN transferase [Lachnospiraceae bacterium]|nr:FAD:protein FMN transferase [Lachnospiraceae bacterium]